MEAWFSYITKIYLACWLFFLMYYSYLLFNFNDYPNGMVTLFNLLVMGNWQVWMQVYFFHKKTLLFRCIYWHIIILICHQSPRHCLTTYTSENIYSISFQLLKFGDMKEFQRNIYSISFWLLKFGDMKKFQRNTSWSGKRNARCSNNDHTWSLTLVLIPSQQWDLAHFHFSLFIIHLWSMDST